LAEKSTGQLLANNLKLIPENLVMGGSGEGGGMMNGFFGISLLEKMTGRSFEPKTDKKIKPYNPIL
jgi:hypothetical protein